MIVSPKAAAKVLAKRKLVAATPMTLDPRFALQNSFVEDKNRFLVAQCSRRSGKTNGLALRFFKTMEKYPRSRCIYLGLTLGASMDVLWPVLHELNDKYRIGCKFTDSRQTMRHPNGATLKLLAADQKNFIKRLKGQRFPGVAIDEAQDYGPHLQSLVDDVLTPSISDYRDGWLALTGTPGPVPHGYFFDITQNRKFGYSFHGWTLLDNPYMPDAAKFLSEVKQKREWLDNNPTLLREYKNQWVLDVQSLWIQYSESKNHYQSLPQLPSPHQYHYAIGIDIGFNDADALAVIAWSDLAPTTYLVEELVTRKQGLTELVEQIEAFQKKYNPVKMVIDEGGLGKKLAEELRRRYGIPVHPADKARKQENVELLNDSMRLGKFMAKSGSRFAQDSYLVQIDWDKSSPDKIVIKKKPHSDIIDAVLYIFRESPAYTFEPAAKAAPKWGTKDWADAQHDEMWERELAGFQEQAELERRISGHTD